MRRKASKVLRVISWALMLSLVGMVSVSHAGTITSLSVSIGANPAIAIWNTQIGAGVDVTGQQAVFTQNAPQGSGNYNFDTSEVLCGGSVANCTNPVIHVGIQGVVGPGAGGGFDFTDGTGCPGAACSTILHTNNTDPFGTVFNEARNWVSLGTQVEPGTNGGTLTLWVGYADNAHSGACADANGTPGQVPGQTANNCVPDNPWNPGGALFFGNAISGGCVGTTNPCFDAGTIRISETRPSPVPEPSVVLLLGAGLMGLAAWRGMRRKA